MEPRTLAELEADVREELDDKVQPYLWSSPRIRQLLNEAVAEANLRARLIVDMDTPEVCRIPLVAGQADYPLHPAIIVIRRAWLDSEPTKQILRTKFVVMDEVAKRWRTATGEPGYIIRSTRNTLTVAPIPERADVLHLEVWRNPIASEIMEGDADDPSDARIEPIWHSKLVHWACYRALTKMDAETEATRMAQFHLQAFEMAFGSQPTAAQLEVLGNDPITSSREYLF